MKRLYLVRHAKSSWANANMTDHDRPLNERGNTDAPFMADRLQILDSIPNAILTSSAKRALSTAKYFQKSLGVDSLHFHIEPALYHSSPHQILECIQNLNDQYESVAVFCHNPGITDFANHISKEYIPNVVTCGVLIFTVNVTHWIDTTFTDFEFIDYIYPKDAED